MSGIVRAPRPAGHFTQIRNDVIRDPRLSYKASGILHDILSRPDNWKTRSEALADARGKEGRDAIRTGLAELKAAGYLEQRRVRDEKGRISTVSYVYDEPMWRDVRESPKEQVKPKTGYPAPDEPEPGRSGAGQSGPFRTPSTNTVEEDLKNEDQTLSLRASSSSPEAQLQDPEDDDAREIEIKIPKVKSKDDRSRDRIRRDRDLARRKVKDDLGITDEQADVLLDYLVETYNAKYLNSYIDTIIENEQLEERWDECSWMVDDQRGETQKRRKEGERIADWAATCYPGTPPEKLAALCGVIIQVQNAGYVGADYCPMLDEVARRAPDGTAVDACISAMKDLAEPTARAA